MAKQRHPALSWTTGFAALLAITGCGGPENSQAPDARGETAGSAAAAAAGGPYSPVAAAASPAALAGRTRELSNPDAFTMILLYYSLSGLPPPADKWVEEDMAVRSAQPADKAAARDAARARIAAGLAAVKDVGLLRVTTDAQLSAYDPTYSEYIVRALAPSSSLVFQQFGERVLVKFDNAQQAQRWTIDKAEAQSVQDRIQYNSSVELDALLMVTGAAPETEGGAITTKVREYELKNRGSGTAITRVTVPQ